MILQRRDANHYSSSAYTPANMELPISDPILRTSSSVFRQGVFKNSPIHYKKQAQNLTSRGVQLAELFMCGVEHAIVANQACGSPVAVQACAPATFFDGKLFQFKLDIAYKKQSLHHICNGHVK